MPQTIDALFIPFYVNVDRWDNDSDDDIVPPSLARTRGVLAALSDEEWMKDEVDLVIDGRLLDFSRFLSLARYGTTRECERYDPFNMTLLSGSYYLNLLHQHAYHVRVANVVDRHKLEELGRRFTPRFVLLSTTLLFDAAERETIPLAVGQIRRQWPQAVVVLGGLMLVSYEKNLPPQAFYDLLRYYGADAYVVSPRGEHPTLEILRQGSLDALLRGPAIPSTYLIADGKLQPPASTPEDAMSLADTYIRWSSLPQTDHLYHVVHMRTARSCAFKCAFCEYPVNQGPLTLVPLEVVDQELQEIKRLGTIKSLVFTDDTFNVPQQRFRELLGVLGKYDFEWYCFFRPQYADRDTAQLMKQAGCRAVFAGLESADDQILKNMNKVARVDDYRTGIEQLKVQGIHVHANFIVGFPGETEASARKIIRFLDDMEIDFCTVCTWVYIPSTPIGRRAAEFKIDGLGVKWNHLTMNSREAQQLARQVVQEQKHAVHNAVRGEAWTEFLLYANGFTVDEVRTLLGCFGRYLNRDVSEAEIRQAPDFPAVQAALQHHEMPRPRG
jgi:p-methyltransferase